MKTNFTTILLAAGLLVGCNEVKKDNVDSAAEVREMARGDTAAMYEDDNVKGSALETDEEVFKKVDFGAPVLEEPVLKVVGIEVRGAEGYRIYTIGEDIMFDLDKAEIRPSGEQKLKEIVKTLKERNTKGVLRVYGFTDSLAGKAYNRQLALKRTRAVENWLRQNSDLDTAQIRLIPVGEHMFEASNRTARGRQQNRRVEIVVVEK